MAEAGQAPRVPQRPAPVRAAAPKRGAAAQAAPCAAAAYDQAAASREGQTTYGTCYSPRHQPAVDSPQPFNHKRYGPYSAFGALHNTCQL
jgi:hypothetical protein